MDKKISIKNLREMLIMHPYLNAQELVDFAEQVADIFANTEKTVIKNQGETVRIQTVGDIVVKEYNKDTVLTIDENKEYYFKGFEPKTEREKAQSKAIEEYKQKFLADVERLKAEKEKKYNENEVKYGKA